MELHNRIYLLVPNFIRNIIKYIYMKGSISYSTCKYVGMKNLIKKNVKIGQHVFIYEIDGNIGEGVEIGDYTVLHGGVTIYSSQNFNVKIGKFCSIAKGVRFCADIGHDYNCLTTYTWKFKLNINIGATITLGHDVWVGTNAIILKGVNIGIGAIVGAGSVVTKDVPPYAIVAGNPAKIIKYRFDDDIIKKLLESERWNRDLERIKSNYYLEFLNN